MLADTDATHQLAAAIHADDAKAITQLLNNRPDLKSKLNDPLPTEAFGSTALLAVVGRGKPDVIDALLDAGADPNARSHWWAGSFGVLDTCDPALAPHLIRRGATLNAHAAAHLGMFDKLKELIAANPALVHSRGGDGQTPLHFASTVEIAQFLLDQGADINARCVDHESTPAQWMIKDRQPVVRFLVDHGCETDILMAAALGDLTLVGKHLESDPSSIRMCVSDEFFPKKNPKAASIIYVWTLGSNKTPHRVARDFGHEDVYRYLMEQSPPEVQLVTALAVGDEPTARALLAAHPNLPQSLTSLDASHLPAAARDNNAAAVKLMVEWGFPVNARGMHGGTALHWAAWHGNAQIVRQILPHNPDLEDSANEFHASPLRWALHGSQNSWHRQTGDYPAAVEALLEAGANPPKLSPDTKATEPVLATLARFAQKISPPLPPQP
ncbi:MAG TPA: ankyrin repeat domain-containing protein, partial [Tepidisphaeraceae bacterium]